MRMRDDQDSFEFPVADALVLINDFAVRKQALDQVPLPLGFAQGGRWVWLNRAGRAACQELSLSSREQLTRFADSLRHEITTQTATLAVTPQLTVRVCAVPVKNVSGHHQGHLVYSERGLVEMLGEELTTGVFVAQGGKILWANRAAKNALPRLAEGMRWDALPHLPHWHLIAEGQGHTLVLNHPHHYLIHLKRVGHYVLAEVQPGVRSGVQIAADQLASLVHEIRNPLAALSGYVEMAQLAAKDAESLGYLTSMMKEVTRLTRLTEDMMALFRPLTIHWQAIRLDELVERAWFSCGQGNVGDSRVQLLKAYALDQIVRGDPDRLLQVLINVMKNAVDAMAEKGSTLTVGYRQQEHLGVITVADDGPGIPAEILSQLFVRRVTTKDSGTGLGLFVVQRLMEAHGGYVDVRSGPGGTMVELGVPQNDPPTGEISR